MIMKTIMMRYIYLKLASNSNFLTVLTKWSTTSYCKDKRIVKLEFETRVYSKIRKLFQGISEEKI